MMPTLTSHLILIIVEQVQAAIIDPSGNPSLVTPIVPPTTNVDEVDPSISSDYHIPQSPATLVFDIVMFFGNYKLCSNILMNVGSFKST
ncbi:hypothetical protein KY290_002012 [Solanum tuberosum]|uniref:Secreted protein n=1 Tax=Solanum tuberosum TaxID=4113 RepID=A0ABQ7WQZ6_SOLTU|nr:hypothetical protein KY290_002012 [Solanum tuberosum]